MGNILTSCGERISKFSCKSSCMISDGEKEILSFRKTLSLNELERIKSFIEMERVLKESFNVNEEHLKEIMDKAIQEELSKRLKITNL